MTIEYVILTSVGVAMLTASARLLKTETDPTIRAWVLGWCAFISAAILGASIEDHGPQNMQLPLMVAYVASSVAPLCFLFGVFALVSFRPPAGLLPLVGMLITARTIFGMLGDHATAEALSLPLEVGAHLCAVWLVWRWARQRGHQGDEIALISAHLLMAFTEGSMAIANMNGWNPDGAKIALLGSTIWLAGVQLVIVLRRSSAVLDKMVENREKDVALLRDLAHLGTRHNAGSALVREAADLLTERLDVGWVGFWRWNEGEARLVATDASRVPEALCAEIESAARWAADGTYVSASPKLERSGDPTPPGLIHVIGMCDALESPGRHFVPLEWRGDVLGVMGVGRASGKPLPLHVRSIVPALAGELSLVLRHVLSIQQRDRANIDLLRERRKLAAVVETAPLGLMVSNGKGIIELMNAASANHAGFSDPEAWIGREVHGFMVDVLGRVSDGDALLGQIKSEVDQMGTFADVELNLTTPEPRTLLLFSTRVKDDDGKPTARVWASRDVTAERALGDQLRHAQKLETLGTLSGGIAHDFNNQLAVILGNVRFARENLESDPSELSDVDDALCDLERAADHCAQLTRSLLSFARRAPVSLGLVEPRQLIRDLGELLRPLIPTCIELQCDTIGDLPPIMADAGQLQQVLVNLALNARDAIEGHGEICVSATTLNLDREQVARTGVGNPGLHLMLRVRDNGHGIDTGALERIFEPFYTTKVVGKGTGLGLAIVHGVVTAHSGWIEVESECGRGTEFRIHLPAEDSAMPTLSTSYDPHHVIALASVEGKRERVLVADDDDAVRNLLVRGLESHGFAVVPVADGELAVKRFSEDPGGFAAVLLDWSMPGLQGPEAAEEIRRIESDVPLLIATGHGALDTDSSFEIVAKPFDIGDIARRLRAQILERDA